MKRLNVEQHIECPPSLIITPDALTGYRMSTQGALLKR
jgi:hypothetical protein